MVLMILAGIYAMAVGHIAVSRTISLKGRYARIYGLVLVLAAVPTSLALSFLVAALFPASTPVNDVYRMIINVVCLAAIIVVLTLPFQKWQERAIGSEVA
jgi:hypothetical protein